MCSNDPPGSTRFSLSRGDYVRHGAQSYATAVSLMPESVRSIAIAGPLVSWSMGTVCVLEAGHMPFSMSRSVSYEVPCQNRGAPDKQLAGLLVSSVTCL